MVDFDIWGCFCSLMASSEKNRVFLQNRTERAREREMEDFETWVAFVLHVK